MNTAEITLGAIILIPLLVILALKINASLIFLSLCLGDVLIQFITKSSNPFMTLFASSKTVNSIVNHGISINIILLLLPVILMTFFMINSVRGLNKILNIIPAIAATLFGALLIVPLLASSMSQGMFNTYLWQYIHHYQIIIIETGAVSSLLILWLERSKNYGDHKNKKHHD